MIPFYNISLPSIATAVVVGIILNAIFPIFPATNIDKDFEEVPVEKLQLEI